jgi:class 3 adenylate cyclase/tetratricopeptide (TPR) repeat protein
MTEMNDLAQLLTEIGLGHFQSAFAENSIDFDLLTDLSENDLKELGLNIGERRRLLRAVRALGNGDVAGALTNDNDKQLETKTTSPAEADRRQLTVMFCDMVGSTALSTRLDAEDYRELIRDYQDACTNVIQEYGGFVAKYMGDGLDAYFGYPSGHENDAERAVLAALDIVEAIKFLDHATENASVAVRIGIATGPVVIGDIIGESSAQEASVTGEMPNLAARLQEIAEPNSVVVEPGTYRLVGPLFDWKDMGPRALKGFSQLIHVRTVDGTRQSESRFDALHARALPGFVGREDELDILARRWEQTKIGEGQVVLLSGEPGIGKSRLMREFQSRIENTEHTTLQWQCSPFHTSSAFYPLIDAIERIAGFSSRDTDQDKLRKLEAWMEIGGFPLDEVLPLYASLLSIPTSDAYRKLDGDAREQREMLFKFQAERFSQLPSKRPVLFLFEDVHWIDPTSLELLELQVERVQDISTLMVITYRPEFEAPWVGRSYVTALTLNRLNRRNATAMTEAIAGAETLSNDIRDQIVEKTDGIPLFVEEMTKSILEASLENGEDDQVLASASIDDRAIPSTLQDSLEARLDRLGLAKEIAQVGAAIGQEFSLKLVAEVLGIEESEIERLVEPLSHSDLFTRRGSGTETLFSFKHALVQQAAYASLLRVPKQNIHRDIASVLEKFFPETAESEPEILAYHCAEAGMIEPAIDWWQRAGARSVAHSAYAEAIAQFKNALGLVDKLSESAGRDAIELDLLIAQFGPIIAVIGLHSPELDQAHVRALELCKKLGDTQKMLPILHARYNYYQGIGRPAIALQFAEEYLKLAEAMDDDTPLMIGHRATGAALWHVGELVLALQHVEQTLELYRQELHHTLVAQYAFDIKTTAFMNQNVLLGSLGYPDRAAAVLRDAIEFTRALDHPASSGFLLGHVGLTQHFIARDPADARKHAEELQALANDFGLAFWVPLCRVHLGRSLFDEGDRQKGIDLMRQSLGSAEERKLWIARPAHQVLLADALVRMDAPEEALDYLDAAQEETDAGEDRWSEPEIWRVRGDALLKSAEVDQAEASYQRAIEVARSQEAKTFELRSATSLARLWADQDRCAEAHDLLAPIYGWFTEGFDTPDLKDAKALLDKLPSAK